MSISTIESGIKTDNLLQVDNDNASLLHLSKLVAKVYKNSNLAEYSARISMCLDKLLQGQQYACQVRGCPICSWKNNQNWLTIGQKAIDDIAKSHPTYKAIFVDFFSEAFELSDLRNEIRYFKESFNRMFKLKPCEQVQGYIRYLRTAKKRELTVELHLQCILIVKAGFYAGEGYISKAKWTSYWNQSLRRTDGIVRTKSLDIASITLEELLLKQEYFLDDSNWFIEYSKQVLNCKFVSYSGIIRKYLKESPGHTKRVKFGDVAIPPEVLVNGIPKSVKENQSKIIDKVGEEKALILAYQVSKEHETPETSRAVWNRAVQLENFYTQSDHREKIKILVRKLENEGQSGLARLSERISNCAIFYNRNELVPRFCGKRECPICQYQRQLAWQERFRLRGREFIKHFSDGRWVLLTFKMEASVISEIRQLYKNINTGFSRFIKKVSTTGWIKNIMIFPSLDGKQAEMEVKALMAFDKGFWAKGYMSEAEWSQLIQKSIRCDYLPETKVQHLKLLDIDVLTNLIGDFTKEIDYTLFEEKQFVDFLQQARRLRLISMGGEVREFFREIKLQRLPVDWEEYFEFQVSNKAGRRVRPKIGSR